MRRTTEPGSPTILLTIPEVARRLSISTRQVYRLLRQGHLHTIHIGTAARVREHDVEAYIDSLVNDPFRTS